MLNLFKLNLILPLLFTMLSLPALSQYTYTRYSLDISGGASLPKTSIAGSLSGYTELGFKGARKVGRIFETTTGGGDTHGFICGFQALCRLLQAETPHVFHRRDAVRFQIRRIL